MKVISIKDIEGCLEGTYIKDIILTEKIDKNFVEYLGKLGRLIYQGDFAKPFFKVIVKGKYTLKGSEQNTSFRVIFPDKDSYSFIDELKEYIERF